MGARFRRTSRNRFLGAHLTTGGPSGPIGNAWARWWEVVIDRHNLFAARVLLACAPIRPAGAD